MKFVLNKQKDLSGEKYLCFTNNLFNNQKLTLSELTDFIVNSYYLLPFTNLYYFTNPQNINLILNIKLVGPQTFIFNNSPNLNFNYCINSYQVFFDNTFNIKKIKNFIYFNLKELIEQKNETPNLKLDKVEQIGYYFSFKHNTSVEMFFTN